MLVSMGRFAVLILAAIGWGQAPEKFQSGPSPALPEYEWNACPGEGCGFGPWTTRKAVVVYTTWKKNRRPIEQLQPAEKVTALTGVVIVFKPGLVRMDRDLPDQELKRGDTILTYGYIGEGYSTVWLKGRYYPEFDISFAKWPDGSGCGGEYCAATYVDLGKKEWWAEVKLKSGRTGWVDMDFDDLPFYGICRIDR